MKSFCIDLFRCKLFNGFTIWLKTFVLVYLLMAVACQQELKNEIVPAAVDIQVDSTWLSAFRKPEGLSTYMYNDSMLTRILAQAILGAGEPSEWPLLLQNYLTDSARLKLLDTCTHRLGSLDFTRMLEKPFGRLQTMFPKYDIPKLHLLITDFNYAIFQFNDQNGRNALGIGLEMFMGAHDWYDQLSIENPNFSSYLNRTFTVDHLPSKILFAIATDLIPEPATNRLIDHILAEGKKLYFVKAAMPELADTIWFECTPAQWDWVQGNELDIWRFLLADKLLYKVAGKEVANLTQPAPHSQGMPPEAPGRAVNYIGYKIIALYSQRSKKTFEQVAAMKDYDEILKIAQYKPRP
jgi:hypothetical protein